MDSARDTQGRFKKGEYHGGPGRPRKTPEPSRPYVLSLASEPARGQTFHLDIDLYFSSLYRHGKDPCRKKLERA